MYYLSVVTTGDETDLGPVVVGGAQPGQPCLGCVAAVHSPAGQHLQPVPHCQPGVCRQHPGGSPDCRHGRAALRQTSGTGTKKLTNYDQTGYHHQSQLFDIWPDPSLKMIINLYR